MCNTKAEEMNKAKINLLSGAYTSDFVDSIWTFTEGDTATLDNITHVFNQLFDEQRDGSLLAVLQIMHAVMGMEFPTSINELSNQPDALSYYLFSFLLDFHDCLLDYMQ